MRRSGRDFLPFERKEIDRIGFTYGCHVCGTKKPETLSGRFIPDHQPPFPVNAILKKPQRLYPICMPCSLAQGLWLVRWAGKE